MDAVAELGRNPVKNDRNLTAATTLRFTAFLISACKTLFSAFDSDRELERRREKTKCSSRYFYVESPCPRNIEF